MAIYISGVRNLPEQVQKNKDDIEDLQTADTNLEAKIDQEIADRKALIEANGNATIIENPTENVAVSLTETETNRIFGVFIDGTPKLTIDGSSIIANQDTAVNGVLEAHGNIEGHSALAVDSHITAGGDITAVGDITTSGDITANGNITATTGDITATTGDITAGGDITTAEGNIYTSLGYIGGSVVKTTIINVPDGNHTIQVNCPDSSNVNHILKFDADTLKLTIDGNEVGGKQLYQHNIGMTTSLSYQEIMLTLITDSSTPMTINDIANYLYEKGFTSLSNALYVNQYIYTTGYYFARRIYATNTTTLKVRIYDETNINHSDLTINNAVDQVLPI